MDPAVDDHWDRKESDDLGDAPVQHPPVRMRLYLPIL